MNNKRPFEIQLSLPVQTYDIDFAGVVSNIVYVRWLEDLRIKMIAQEWPVKEQFAKGIAPVLASTTIRYQQAVYLQDNLVGRMWMERLKRLKWFVSAEFWRGADIVATAEQTGCFLNLDSQKPEKVPEHILKAYQKWC